jgi:PKD repeat protein
MAEEPKPQLKVAPQAVVVTAPPARVPDSSMIKAVVNARPVKGFSPLRVQFSAKGSFSPHARIVSYFWDFGDGDVSKKANPVNTYYSASFEPRHFTATLTVQDNLGNTSSQSIIIEVLNK